MPHAIHRPARVAALAFVLALGSIAMTATAQVPATAAASSDGTLLLVSARGEASRAPDIATASAGVTTQAADANTALRENAARMTRVIEAIRAAGVAERDIQTTGINIHPNYRHVENEAPVISGYSASNSVSLKVRDVAKLGEVLDALVASGATNVNGPSFGIDRPEVVQDEARRNALEQARARADMYASALDLRVRRIVSVSEGGSIEQPRPMHAMRAMAAMDSQSTPVAPGENTLTANLEVVFELGR